MTPKERAAKAIEELGIHDFVTPAESATAAFSAIAEPSREMLCAAVSLYPGLSPRVAAAIWRAMHASMMAEKDTGK